MRSKPSQQSVLLLALLAFLSVLPITLVAQVEEARVRVDGMV